MTGSRRTLRLMPPRRPANMLATLLGITLLGGCTRQEEPAAPPPTPVRIAAVTAGPASPPIEATGFVAARDEQRLSFKVGGMVQQVRVREGDTVRRGELLALLDQTEIDAQLAQVAQLAEQAARDLARGEALHADQVIPLEQLENLRTQAAVARARHDAARFNARNAAIHATGDGVVLRRLVEARENVAPGQVVLVVGNQDSGHVLRFAVADRHVVRIRRGEVASVQLDAWPGESFRAEIIQVASGADPATGLFPVEARLDAVPHTLVSGLVGRVQLAAGADDSTLPHVPIGAVLEGDGDRAVVYVVDGQVARRRDVQVAFITADSVAVRVRPAEGDTAAHVGLTVGEQVVTAGAPYLDDGDAITVVPGPSP